MKRLILGVLAGLLVGATGAPAANPTDTPTPQQAAASAAGDYLAPLLAPDYRRVSVRVAYCRERGTWYGCRVAVSGKTRCHGVLRVRAVNGTYAAWMPRMRCR